MIEQRFSKYANYARQNTCCNICEKSDFDLIHENINTWENHQWWVDGDDGGEIICDCCKEKIEKETMK